LIADDVQKAVGLPLLHIADATAKAIQSDNLSKVALLGTKFVMDQPFFRDKLSLFGIETILPNNSGREFIHNSIFSELTKGIFTEETKERYLNIIERLIGEGAEGIICACTEIPILLQNKTVSVKTFDTTLIHAKAAVAFATDN
jgi:aspartate racemase